MESMKWKAGKEEAVFRGFSPEFAFTLRNLFTLGNGAVLLPAYPEEGTHAPSRAVTYANEIVDRRENGKRLIPCADWLFVRFSVNGQHLMLDEKNASFSCSLDLKTGLYTRKYTLTMQDGSHVTACFERLLSMENPLCAVQKITLIADAVSMLSMNIGVDGNIEGENEEKIWSQTGCEARESQAFLSLKNTLGQEAAYLFQVDSPLPMMALNIDKRVVFGINGMLQKDTPFVIERKAVNLIGSAAPSLSALNFCPDFSGLLEENARHYGAFWQSAFSGKEDGFPGELAFSLFQAHQYWQEP